jgi:unsaturated chondroitin disaccharide hydrolase
MEARLVSLAALLCAAGAGALPLAPPPADAPGAAAAAAAAAASGFAAPFPESLYATIAAAANATATQLGDEGLYTYPSNGIASGKYGWATSSSGGWTAGFYPAIWWKLYERSGLTDELAFAQANARSAGLASQMNNRGTHDVGFMVYTPFGAQYRLTGNATALRIVQQTAESLCSRFSPKVGCTESWGSFPPTNDVFEVIADNMMNLELLWFAGTYAQNQTILDIANSHTRRMVKDIFQPAAISGGGCVWHLLTYSYSTGELRNRSSTPQGLGLDTVWSRGQAWIVNGFAIAHRFTGDLSYLAQAQGAAECYIRKVSACCGASSGFAFAPLWDFSVANPGPQVAVDTSATMIAADGIIEIAWRSDAATRARYLAFAKASIDAVLAQYTFAPAANDAVLNNGTTSWPGFGISIIYADYYLLEAAMRWDATPGAWRAEAAAFAERGASFTK